MKIEKQDSKIVVEVDGNRVSFDKSFDEEVNFLHNGSLHKVKEWEKELVENHGVDINEL